MFKKASFFLSPVAGVVLFLGVLIFTLYAFNHPEGGFAFEISVETTLVIYFSYVGITVLVLVAGSVLLFAKGFDNAIQQSGADYYQFIPINFINSLVQRIITLYNNKDG